MDEYAQFDEDFYRGAYGELDAVIPSQYPTGLAQFKAVGQFSGATKKEGLYTGSSKNDTVTPAKADADADIYGVGITATYTDGSGPTAKVIYKPDSLGVGEQDTLVGRADATKEDGFFLSTPNGEYSRNNINDPLFGTSSRLYVGRGNRDYARIKNFNVEYDYVSLSGAPKDYIYRYEADKISPGGYSTKIYTKAEKDLVGIVEGINDIQPRRFLKDGTFRLSGRVTDRGFNDNVYNLLNGVSGGLTQYVTNGQFRGKTGIFSGAAKGTPVSNSSTPADGNDTLVGIGSKTLLSGVELSTSGSELKAGTGAGQADTLIGSSDGKDLFLLGFASKTSALTAFYVGGAEKDFAKIQNYESRDRVVLAGNFSDYTFTTKGGNVEIAKSGDLIGIVEGALGLRNITSASKDGQIFTVSFSTPKDGLGKPLPKNLSSEQLAQIVSGKTPASTLGTASSIAASDSGRSSSSPIVGGSGASQPVQSGSSTGFLNAGSGISDSSNYLNNLDNVFADNKQLLNLTGNSSL